VRVLVVIGTRPEAIKLAPLVHALSAAGGFSVRICITSQHTDLLAPMLAFFGLRPDVDLRVMTPGQTLAGVTTRVLGGMDELLAREQYDLIVVQGDTTTAFAAGLAAFYRHVPVAHVEAGLRSGDLARPFPEEANRRFVDVISAYLLAPTPGARANLVAEGYPAGRIFVTGNTGIDALFLAADIVRKQARPLPIDLPPGARLALVTAHRRESFGEGLARICTALVTLLERYPDLHLLYPVHPNPNVVETTNRPEGVAVGAAELVGTDTDRIVSRAAALLDGEGARHPVVSPYGDGRASERIVEVLRSGVLRSPFGA
jgi:UDP-N-acetylglucosamine 2-epimerase (non-hydrolysing)